MFNIDVQTFLYNIYSCNAFFIVPNFYKNFIAKCDVF